jgi:hypothetical protein
LQTLRDVAAEVDAKPGQVALAWLISLPGVVAIPGASSVEQLEFNVATADIELKADSRDTLTEAARAFRPVSTLSLPYHRYPPREAPSSLNRDPTSAKTSLWMSKRNGPELVAGGP